jgi:hypothetical protein
MQTSIFRSGALALTKRDSVLPAREQSFRLDFLVPFWSSKKGRIKYLTLRRKPDIAIKKYVVSHKGFI